MKGLKDLMGALRRAQVEFILVGGIVSAVVGDIVDAVKKAAAAA